MPANLVPGFPFFWFCCMCLSCQDLWLIFVHAPRFLCAGACVSGWVAWMAPAKSPSKYMIATVVSWVVPLVVVSCCGFHYNYKLPVLTDRCIIHCICEFTWEVEAFMLAATPWHSHHDELAVLAVLFVLVVVVHVLVCDLLQTWKWCQQSCTSLMRSRVFALFYDVVMHDAQIPSDSIVYVFKPCSTDRFLVFRDLAADHCCGVRRTPVLSPVTFESSSRSAHFSPALDFRTVDLLPLLSRGSPWPWRCWAVTSF